MRVPTWLLAISCVLCLLAALAVGRQPARAVVERGVVAGDVLAIRTLVAALKGGRATR